MYVYLFFYQSRLGLEFVIIKDNRPLLKTIDTY